MRQRNIANDAQRMARAAVSDMANLQRALRRAQDSVAGLNRTIKVPNTTPRRHTIKASRTSAPLIFTMLGAGLGGFLASDVASGLGDDSGSAASFGLSAGQIAANLARGVMRGQRIL
jgi:outer membrane lipoprotein SlyB